MENVSPKCESVVTAVADSPVGDIELMVCRDGLHRLHWSSTFLAVTPNLKTKVQIKDKTLHIDNKWLDQSVLWLTAFFESDPRLESLAKPNICPTIFKSEFNQKVLMTLMNGTKLGERISYSELANRAVGKPMAGRAVGTAMMTNPIPLMIPCHRVIKKDGSLGKFAGTQPEGPTFKAWLLSHEEGLAHK